MNDELLGIYLNDHLAGAVMASELAERTLRNTRDDALRAFLAGLIEEVREDVSVLRALRERIGGSESTVKDAAAWLFDKLSRTKLTELSKHRELSRLEELELLTLGILGKLGLWKALEAVCRDDDRFRDVDFGQLQRRARAQYDALDRRRIEAARHAFTERQATRARDGEA